MAEEPLVSDVDWPSAELVECPFPFYASLREQPALTYFPERNEFLVTRWDDVVHVLEHPEIFVQRPSAGEIGAAEKRYVPLVHTNPPEHWPRRSLAMRVVARDRMRRCEPKIRALADELIDAFIDHGDAEFYEQFSAPLPVLVICNVLGLPREDAAFVRRVNSREGVGVIFLDDEQRAVHRALQEEEAMHMEQRLLERYKRPRDDFLSELVQAQVERDGVLDIDTLVADASIVMRGGNVTTTHMMASALMLLLQHPDEMQRVVEDHSLIAPLLEETMRLESPVQFTPRLAKVDTELSGTAIPAGATVIALLAAGNRDADCFSEPETLSLDRENLTKHQLAFGRGAHFCLGAPLARLEGRIAFEQVLSRLANIRLAPGKNDFAHIESFSFRAPKALYIEFDRA